MGKKNPIQENVERILREGPGIKYGQKYYIIARDRANKRVYARGFGGMGVGCMWTSESGHTNDPDFDDAPEIASLDAGLDIKFPGNPLEEQKKALYRYHVSIRGHEWAMKAVVYLVTIREREAKIDKLFQRGNGALMLRTYLKFMRQFHVDIDEKKHYENLKSLMAHGNLK